MIGRRVNFRKACITDPLGLARGSTRVLRASPEIMASVLGKLIQTPEESERD